MHSNHCYHIKQSQSRFRPGTEDRQRGAMTRERLGVARTSPRDREVRGILQQPLQRGWRGIPSGGVPGPGVCAERKRRTEVELRPDPRPPGSQWSKMATVKSPKPPAAGLTRQPTQASIIQKIQCPEVQVFHHQNTERRVIR